MPLGLTKDTLLSEDVKLLANQRKIAEEQIIQRQCC